MIGKDSKEEEYILLGSLLIRVGSYASNIFHSAIEDPSFHRISTEIVVHLVEQSNGLERVQLLTSRHQLEQRPLPSRCSRKTVNLSKFFFRHLYFLSKDSKDVNGMLDSVCGVLGCKACRELEYKESETRFRLHKVFEELKESFEDNPVVVSNNTANKDCLLFSLPDDLFYRILDCLSVQEVRYLARTCKLARKFCDLYVPGLKLTLLPHQRRALKFMLKRESKVRVLTISFVLIYECVE